MAVLLILAGCGGSGGDSGGGGAVPGPTPKPVPTSTPTPVPTSTPTPIPTPTPSTPTTSVTSTVIGTFSDPWALTFLPDGRMLVTEKGGTLHLVDQQGNRSPVPGLPEVSVSGQTGLHDVVTDPAYSGNGRIWFSYAEPVAGGGSRVAVANAVLAFEGSPRVEQVNVVWRANVTAAGGHPGGRIAFGPDGYVYISSGERQQGAPALDLTKTIGKIIRITTDGQPAPGNPFLGGSDVNAEIWSYGHRNPYGLVFSVDGQLLESEMGPEGGDEFNRIRAGANYGWDRVSEGNAYGGPPYPKHSTDTSVTAPAYSWSPVIAPGGMIQYTGSRFVGWNGDFVLAGLVSRGLVRVRFDGNTATEVARIDLGARIREVEQGPDGTIWVLEDGADGRLRRLDPN
ncbi:MAG: PQQ-dependent sugar dehydrogenase [Akkermansiaceae bacterium]|nr:PQQ-dependent sugar dehydrogenase [Armatimonadota bacterium]